MNSSHTQVGGTGELVNSTPLTPAPPKNKVLTPTQKVTLPDLETVKNILGALAITIAYGFLSGTYQLPKSPESVRYQQPAPESTPSVDNLLKQFQTDVRDLVKSNN